MAVNTPNLMVLEFTTGTFTGTLDITSFDAMLINGWTDDSPPVYVDATGSELSIWTARTVTVGGVDHAVPDTKLGTFR